MIDNEQNASPTSPAETVKPSSGKHGQTPYKVIKLADVKEDIEYSPEEFNQMVKLYEDTLTDFVEGEVIVGKILAIGDKEVAIDIGFKSEGTVPIEEFTNPQELQIGQDIEIYLDNIEDKEGQLILSKKKADFMHTWDEITKKHETGELIKGKCMRRIKGGIVVDLLGIDAFLPGSQIDVKPIRDFDAFIGKTIDFKIVKVNQLRKNIVVSHRVLIEELLVGQREKILNELFKGQILEGGVKNITDFGVFIDLGGADGLLHINDLSWGRVSHPSEVVTLDQKIKVMVLDYNDEKNRISLGLKQLQPHPWENIISKYPVGTIVKGKVVNISDYGAFVELEKGVEGLIHISEMSWTQHIKHPSKILAMGEIIEAKILNIDQEAKKISLGLKQLEPDPWDLLEGKYPVGSKHKGKVRNLTNFGAFVELEEGIDGLIHISDLSWTKKIRHPAEVVKKGDSIDVVVLEVDRENRRISLGYKQTSESPWIKFEDDFKVGTVVKGKIVRLIEKGVIAELNNLVDGFVPFTHLAKPNLVKPSDGYKVGDEVELCVIEFNKESKKIVCSEKIDYAQDLIRRRAQEGKVNEPIVEPDAIDEEFSIDSYPEDLRPDKIKAETVKKVEPVAEKPALVEESAISNTETPQAEAVVDEATAEEPKKKTSAAKKEPRKKKQEAAEEAQVTEEAVVEEASDEATEEAKAKRKPRKKKEASDDETAPAEGSN
jgi:small subunit ribosomal protein S1